MSSLTALEKRKVERLLGMGTGYVLDFSNRSFQEFILDIAGRDIFDKRYDYSSGSKANRLRAFWTSEPDQLVASVLSTLIDYAAERESDASLIADCRAIVERLRLSAPVQDLDAINPNASGRDFETLAKSVRESIEKNQPEEGLDRLHTFVLKYTRVLCERNGITTERDKPLHSVFGEYLKSLKNRGLVQSAMAERILKSTISVLEAFNTVRNEQSLAHDNPLLSYGESLLIFNNVATAIRFIASIESAAAPSEATQSAVANQSLPL